MDFETKPVSSEVTPPEPEQQPDAVVTAPRVAAVPPAPSGRFHAVKTFLIANKWYVLAIILGLAIISILAFFAFRSTPTGPNGEANIDLSIDAPDTAPSGSEVIYKFKIQNNDPATLTHMELELVYPEGFTYGSSTPNAENLSGTLYTIPDLSSGQNAVVILKVTAQGSINDDKKLVAKLHYRYSNFNSDFIKQSEKSIRLVASDVVLELSGPDTTTNTQVGSYTLKYKNESDHDINGARIQLTYPEGFTYGSSNPLPSLGKNIWNVGTLKQNDTGTIAFQGSFTTARPGQRGEFKAEFLVQDDKGDYYSQATTNFTTTVSSVPLLVTQEVQNADDNIVDPGGSITFSIHYQNNSQVAATGVSVVASVDSKAIDLLSIRADGGAEINNNTITWTASSISKFVQLNPNESGTLQYTVNVRNPLVKDTSKNITVASSVKIKSNEYSTYLPGNDLSLKTSSPSSLSSGVVLVSGPNPPQNGSSSVYQITLSLKNATNDMNNGLLSGFVGTNIGGFDSSTISASEAKNVTYDPTTGKLIWKVGTLAAHTGDFNPQRKLSFQIKVSPSVAQSGQEVTLFKNVKYSATDSFTGEGVELQVSDTNSNQVVR